MPNSLSRLRTPFVYALIAALLAGLIGCSPQSMNSQVEPHVLQVRISAVRSGQIPATLRSAGFTSGIRLPGGWVVDQYGAPGDGRWLAVSATDAGRSSWGTASIAIDTKRLVADVHPQINAGWYSVDAIIAAGWLVHQEKQQLPSSRCPGQAADDCFIWRLYAVPADGHSAPRLLASSKHPGSQLNSPVPLLTGDRVSWVQGSENHFEVRSWRVGTGSIQTLSHLDSYGNLYADGSNAVVVQRAPNSSNWVVRATDADGHTIGVFSGRPISALRGRRFLYLPGDGSPSQTWRLGELSVDAAATARSTHPIAVHSFDVVRAGFIDNGTAYALTESALFVIDTVNGDILARLPTSASLSIPRVSGTALTLVDQLGAERAEVLLREPAG